MDERSIASKKLTSQFQIGLWRRCELVREKANAVNMLAEKESKKKLLGEKNRFYHHSTLHLVSKKSSLYDSKSLNYKITFSVIPEMY